jgi:hypothetical protein
LIVHIRAKRPDNATDKYVTHDLLLVFFCSPATRRSSQSREQEGVNRDNDIETEISNQYGRLISNTIVYYNSTILSRLQGRLEAEENAKDSEA